jgi:trigger factor
MLETQERQMVQEFAQNMQMQGLSLEQYLQFTGLTMEKLMEQVKPQAEKRIKSRLVLEAVVEAEKIEVSDAEYEEELAKMAEAYKMEVEQIKEIMDDERAVEMKKDMAIQKAVEFVVANAKEK